jgi:hypothetical protein
MRPLAGRATLGLGHLERQLGLKSAGEHFRSAAARFRELEMTRWAEESERALGDLL